MATQQLIIAAQVPTIRLQARRVTREGWEGWEGWAAHSLPCCAPHHIPPLCYATTPRRARSRPKRRPTCPSSRATRGTSSSATSGALVKTPPGLER
eukprot:scaffold25405_cov53-Phaeocystis_antarctica.AAC.5